MYVYQLCDKRNREEVREVKEMKMFIKVVKRKTFETEKVFPLEEQSTLTRNVTEFGYFVFHCVRVCLCVWMCVYVNVCACVCVRMYE